MHVHSSGKTVVNEQDAEVVRRVLHMTRAMEFHFSAESPSPDAELCKLATAAKDANKLLLGHIEGILAAAEAAKAKAKADKNKSADQQQATDGKADEKSADVKQPTEAQPTTEVAEGTSLPLAKQAAGRVSRSASDSK